MPIKNHGQNACIAFPSWTENQEQVTKLFVTEKSRPSQARETDPRMLEILRRIDPMQKEYSYALSVSRVYIESPARDDDIQECQNVFRDEPLRPTADISSLQLIFLEPDPMDRSFTGTELQILRNSLQKLHANGIVHNDIQINNVMRNPSTNALVWSDFGEALLRTDLDEETWTTLVAKDNSNFESNVKNFQVLNQPRVSKKRSRLPDSPGPSFSLTGISPAEPAVNRLGRFLGELIGASNMSPTK